MGTSPTVSWVSSRLCLYFCKNLEDGWVNVLNMAFNITVDLIAQMIGLPNVGKLVKREKHPRVDELKLFDKALFRTATDNGVIYHARLPKP